MDQGGKNRDDGDWIEVWEQFHKTVEGLHPDLRKVVELLWYLDLSGIEAAEILGIDKSTVKRRWRNARVKLVRVLASLLPEEFRTIVIDYK
jgi:DNA-directed RNA polymerase specialized sigma24 family protein